jgi:signal transduction histidine kinase
VVTRVSERLASTRAWITGTFVLAGGAVTGWMLGGNSSGPMPLVLLIGADLVAAYRPLREVLAAAAVMAGLLIVLVLGDVPDFGPAELVGTSAAFGGAFLIGWTAQSRRQRIGALELGQAEAALRAAADERLRIAQELHDVVAHSLGVIAVQAGVGLHVIDTDVAEARRAFGNISRTSRSSLTEIRRLLAVVRSDEGSPSYAPVPGLSDLPRLVKEVTDAGLVVELDVEGDLAGVPPGVGLAAYRIVQEALTNTLRHANADRANVQLDCTGEVVAIEVVDDGRGPHASRAPGHGLIGMRERVAVYGGTLDTGARVGRGYRVAAELPYEVEQTV